jgi:sulfate transport system ATP-binding protein
MSISVQNITKRFGTFTALDNVSLEVAPGTLTALLGPSGSGKTTLLRIIAGLEDTDSGSVIIQDEDATRRSPRERNVGFVFQHYALFRHMSVFENIAFGLRVRNVAKEQVHARVKELVKLIQLEGLETRYPAQLSGGQRQRVALARALAPEPKMLLLDEPFGALDARVRQELRHWMRKLHEDLNVTSILVTHDQEEAFEVADQVVVMCQGKVEQTGTPADIFDHPASPFVMQFVGQVNVFRGRALLGINSSDGHPHPDVREIYVRPHEMGISRQANGKTGIAATVLFARHLGPVARIHLKVPEMEELLTVEISSGQFMELELKEGDEVFVVPRRLRRFPVTG